MLKVVEVLVYIALMLAAVVLFFNSLRYRRGSSMRTHYVVALGLIAGTVIAIGLTKLVFDTFVGS
jgi:hypothetical protein